MSQARTSAPKQVTFLIWRNQLRRPLIGVNFLGTDLHRIAQLVAALLFLMRLCTYVAAGLLPSGAEYTPTNVEELPL
jgi:hypothetical protein